ncbi:Helicase domain-containing protein [Acidipropionibacterium acidipropionici ATCC 4875]|uniref:Helicase domain-containing protein n=1 Tax=Acidipropionibacterium acidipropionici (strain ATCC 4875 / DSM 20272 / JCM 6432 / NBRC 12425 / NCIMB 8070 / 4) TaxID=1171373 RepID=K7RUM4_ACIA4|nr:helicase-related protein [Acidipropionibacterium acidipropionici]AFV90116.1 Helicase domain-containing protein [Acidipropionibacterium acidipropionici ATCC 4875]
MDDADWQIDVEAELEPLKDFQRRTVENAFNRLYGDADPVDSFLVADEVGLGKTLVARGVIARAVDHVLRIEGRSQARILYICSNAQIARQNLPKLTLGPRTARAEQSATRLTLMPAAPSSQRLTFTAFTPGTSISFGDPLGHADERVRLYLLLKHAGIVDDSTAESREAWRQFLRGWSGLESFSHQISSAQDRRMWDSPDEHRLAEALRRDLDEGVGFGAVIGTGDPGRRLTTSRLIGIVDEFRGVDIEPDGDLSNRRTEAVAVLRRRLAWLVAASFRPDLVVLDEFQRFKDLLPDPAADDARRDDVEFSRKLMAIMLGRLEGDGRPSRMLLLSATPYRMYTQGRDAEGDDHYDDFIATVRALADGRTTTPSGHSHADSVEKGLATVRRAMRSHDLERARQGRDLVQDELRRIMSRTERLAATPDRDGMLTTVNTPAGPLTAADVADYVSLRAVARCVGSYDPLELWRSAPHTLAMMDERTRYDMEKLIHRILRPDTQGEVDDRAIADVAAALALPGQHRVAAPVYDDASDSSNDDAGDGAQGDADSLTGLARMRLDAGNPKMRTLMRDLWGDSGAEDDGTPESWRMIWVPPAMPRRRLSGPYRGAGRFSKRLVFSQWAVAPKSISILVSNRSQSLARDAARSVRGDSWQPLRYPLRPGVRKESGSLSKVWTWGMAYPSWVLAELGDVTGYTRRTGQSLPVDPDEQRRDVAERLRPRLAELAERFGEGRGAVDARWYGVAGVLLDRLAATVSGAPWVGPARLGLVGSLPGNSEGIHAHLEALDDPGTLGAQPDDLADRLAQLALAAPGVCALRALAGVESGDSSEQWSDALRWKPVRSGALRIGWAMLRLFDRAEIQAAIWAGFQVDHGRRLAEEDPESRSQAYLRAALDQCLAGDLDAVFSEYLHQIGEAVGMFESGRGTDAMTRVVDEVVSALTIKTANQQLRPLTVQDGRVMEAEPEKMPCRFALRYGDAAATDQAENRSEMVRTAFNSPFWPFALATTSAGQEGIDFHRYCRCVVHWNLPSNPVDLEQREGRVHRYKCLAVRQNVASTWGPDVRVWQSHDPWKTVFRIAEEAVASSGAGDEMRPLWVWSPDSGDGVRIERRVLPLPLSREQGQYRRLVRMLGSYRMAFGQPRQEELLAVLGPDADDADLARAAMIDLTPNDPAASTGPWPPERPGREGRSSGRPRPVSPPGR